MLRTIKKLLGSKYKQFDSSYFSHGCGCCF